jgi:hypothetical protein
VRKVARDRRLEGLDTLKGATSNALRHDLREEALDLVQPAGAGQREMHVVARVTCKPPGDRRRAMSAVVVHDDVDLTPSAEPACLAAAKTSGALGGEDVDGTAR